MKRYGKINFYKNKIFMRRRKIDFYYKIYGTRLVAPRFRTSTKVIKNHCLKTDKKNHE